jgi:hypothetical protein
MLSVVSGCSVHQRVSMMLFTEKKCGIIRVCIKSECCKCNELLLCYN